MIVKASFDDATIQDMRVADLMKKHNIPTIFYWPVLPYLVNEPRNRQSLAPEHRQKIAKDFEIGSHTLSHPLLTRIPLEEANEQILSSRLRLQDEFQQDINSFCYPRGYSNPKIQELVINAGYSNARSTLVGYVHESENPYFEQTALHVACDRKEYAGSDWFDYGLRLLEIARKTPDSIFHLWGHSWEIEKNNQWDRLEKFLQVAVS